MSLYNPEKKYIFCIPRYYQTDDYIPFLRYLNDRGQKARVLVGERIVHDELQRAGIDYETLYDLPDDYDFLLSKGFGLIPFDRYWGKRNMLRGRINICIGMCLYTYRYVHPYMVPERTRFGHAMCVSDRISMENLKEFNREFLYLVSGVPMWDFFSTKEFSSQVREVHRRYGQKLLVLGITDGVFDREREYYRMAIRIAEQQGFNVIFQMKSGSKDKWSEFGRFINSGIPRHVLYAAASHLINSMTSMMAIEAMYLGTKAGCNPLAYCPDTKKYFWCEDLKLWHDTYSKMFEKERFDLLPLLQNKDQIKEFLSDSRPCLTRKQFHEKFGLPEVGNFTAYNFELIEQFFSPENKDKIAAIMKKNQLALNMEADYTTGAPLEVLPGLEQKSLCEKYTKTGLYYLENSDFVLAQRYFYRALMSHSGTDMLEKLQYLRAICFYHLGQLYRADKCIYQALYLNRSDENYKQLKEQIDSQKKSGFSEPAEAFATAGVI